MDPNHLMLLPYSDESTFEEIRNKVTAFLKAITLTRQRFLEDCHRLRQSESFDSKMENAFPGHGARAVNLHSGDPSHFWICDLRCNLFDSGTGKRRSIMGSDCRNTRLCDRICVICRLLSSALSRARKQVRFEREHEKVLGRPPAGAWRVRFGYAFGSVGALLNLPLLINVFIWLVAWDWMWDWMQLYERVCRELSRMMGRLIGSR